MSENVGEKIIVKVYMTFPLFL